MIRVLQGIEIVIHVVKCARIFVIYFVFAMSPSLNSSAFRLYNVAIDMLRYTETGSTFHSLHSSPYLYTNTISHSFHTYCFCFVRAHKMSSIDANACSQKNVYQTISSNGSAERIIPYGSRQYWTGPRLLSSVAATCLPIVNIASPLFAA